MNAYFCMKHGFKTKDSTEWSQHLQKLDHRGMTILQDGAEFTMTPVNKSQA